MTEKLDTPDRRAAGRAAKQHGVVTTAQLREAGLDDDAVRWRRRTGRLHRVHRGVYAWGHPSLSREGWWMAAILASGPEAVLSHRSAAALWRLLTLREGACEVSVPSAAGRAKRAGIRLYRRQALPAGGCTRRDRIPVTTPPQTIADLRTVASAPEWRRAVRQAEVLGLSTGLPDRDATRSELETMFLRLCRRAGMTPPQVNARLGGYLVDFLWRRQRLVVETDGYRFHRGRSAFEEDRRRDLALRALGYDVIRFSYRQIAAEPGTVAEALARALREAR
jgi:very-short-patch-repair endonuclease